MLVNKISDNLGRKLSAISDNLKEDLDKNVSHLNESLNDGFDWDYWQGQDKLRDFYTKYGADYDSQLN
jgi:hypothetical protein